ncbi:hypothetical protein RLOatenuis_3620 [Rickettsiales bacterium]|nr:hypothetical protein RLOatenuis_3620 [Rickettsiales bacterium]
MEAARKELPKQKLEELGARAIDEITQKVQHLNEQIKIIKQGMLTEEELAEKRAEKEQIVLRERELRELTEQELAEKRELTEQERVELIKERKEREQERVELIKERKERELTEQDQGERREELKKIQEELVEMLKKIDQIKRARRELKEEKEQELEELQETVQQRVQEQREIGTQREIKEQELEELIKEIKMEQLRGLQKRRERVNLEQTELERQEKLMLKVLEAKEEEPGELMVTEHEPGAQELREIARQLDLMELKNQKLEVLMVEEKEIRSAEKIREREDIKQYATDIENLREKEQELQETIKNMAKQVKTIEEYLRELGELDVDPAGHIAEATNEQVAPPHVVMM